MTSIRRILCLTLLAIPSDALTAGNQHPSAASETAKASQCHGEKKSKGKVMLQDFSFAQGSPEKLKLWERVLEALEGGDMPPEEEKKRPTAAERKEIAALLAGELRRQTQQLATATMPRAAAPSRCVARRITNGSVAVRESRIAHFQQIVRAL